MGGGSNNADEFSVTFQLAEKGSVQTKDMSQTVCQLICVTHILPSGSWSEVLFNPIFISISPPRSRVFFEGLYFSLLISSLKLNARKFYCSFYIYITIVVNTLIILYYNWVM